MARLKVLRSRASRHGGRLPFCALGGVESLITNLACQGDAIVQFARQSHRLRRRVGVCPVRGRFALADPITVWIAGLRRVHFPGDADRATHARCWGSSR
jgi:hypothetical protein